MSKAYAREKFATAERILATGAKDIHDRLRRAGLECLLPEADDIPEELRDDYNWIRERLTSTAAAGDEGDMNASIDAMTTDEAIEVAERICDVRHGLSY